MTSLDPLATELVLRRAVELTTVEPSTGLVELTPSAVAAIAAEVGVPAATVAAAIAEHQAGADVKRNLVDRLVGPGVVWARRSSGASEAATRERAEQWLSVGHGLSTRVRPDGVVVANKKRGVVGAIAAGARRARGTGGLSRVRQVQVAAVDVDDTPGAVCLVADITNKRSEAVAGGAALATGGALFVGLVAIFTGPLTFIALPAVAGAGAAVSRVAHRSTVRRVTDDVEVTIDGIATGESPQRPVNWPKRS
ncbi:MAG: hypothetical protein ACI8TP_003924 [Acidimicrobiales bacterium]|jgi:hypothetical protein